MELSLQRGIVAPSPVAFVNNWKKMSSALDKNERKSTGSEDSCYDNISIKEKTMDGFADVPKVDEKSLQGKDWSLWSCFACLSSGKRDLQNMGTKEKLFRTFRANAAFLAVVSFLFI